MKTTVKILMIEQVTHDVKRFVLEKPAGFKFMPGQGTTLAVNQPHWETEARPFTPTSLNEDGVLEFTIKGYPEHQGMTARLHGLSAGDELILATDVFGTITYRGCGTFIAGGAGLTPFLAILRQLHRDGSLAGHRLIFSNKRHEDIILERELRCYLGEDAIFTLTRESRPGYLHGRVNEKFLADHLGGDFGQEFYVCGPPPFVADVSKAIERLGTKTQNVVFEE